ncbi:hypothetical protein B0H16DRAFT_1452511 [Mycena metata]|uniref:Uncharacterized protein n=1 Tax=Mycena metata TaxID=1033252 RepID=A0AAD7JPK6_9AGAR|nr:hypothetical protein B0H16DRAFT_1452511 [Mycena metata]
MIPRWWMHWCNHPTSTTPPSTTSSPAQPRWTWTAPVTHRRKARVKTSLQYVAALTTLFHINELQEGHQHEHDNLPSKRQAVTPPKREQPDNLCEETDHMKQDIRTACREKKEVEKHLAEVKALLVAAQTKSARWAAHWNQAEAGVEVWKENTKVALNIQLHKQVAKTKVELAAEAAVAVKKVREEVHEEAQQIAKAGVAVREAELKETIARVAEFETKMAVFRTRESTQRRGVGQPNDGGVPNGTPIHRTELHRVETVMCEGGNHLPTFTVIALVVGPSSGHSSSGPAPTPDPQQIGQGALPVDQDLMVRMIAEAVTAAMKKKASPKKKRNIVPRLRAQLDMAKKWQQDHMSRADDLSWKVRLSSFVLQFRGLNSQQKFVDVVWHHAQSREKADHFHNYDPAPESLMLHGKLGSSKSRIPLQCRPNFGSKLIGRLLAWKRNQIRAGEGEEEKNDHVAKWTDKHRVRTVATSRKTHKFKLRMAGAKHMILRCVAERDDSGISMWTWMVEVVEVVSELGHTGMSSEDDRSVIPTVGRSQWAKTVHIIKICPWQLEKITEYLEYINEVTAETMSKGHSHCDRQREEARSNTLTPLGLPHSLYDVAWLSHMKARVPDIEEQLQISDKEFQIMDIQMDWPQAPGEAMEIMQRASELNTTYKQGNGKMVPAPYLLDDLHPRNAVIGWLAPKKRGKVKSGLCDQANNFEGPLLGKDFPADVLLFPGRPRWFTSSMGFISMDLFGHHPVQEPIYAAPDFSWIQVKDLDYCLYYVITRVDTIIKNNVHAVFDAWDRAGDRKACIDVCRSEEEAEKVVADDKSNRQCQVSPTDSPISYSPVFFTNRGSVPDDAWEKEHWLSPRWD